METKDLLLRNWQDTDAEPLYEMCLDPALRASGIHFYRFLLQTVRIPSDIGKTTRAFR